MCIILSNNMSNTVYRTAFAANHNVHKTWYMALNFRLSIYKNAPASGTPSPRPPSWPPIQPSGSALGNYWQNLYVTLLVCLSHSIGHDRCTLLIVLSRCNLKFHPYTLLWQWQCQNGPHHPHTKCVGNTWPLLSEGWLWACSSDTIRCLSRKSPRRL